MYNVQTLESIINNLNTNRQHNNLNTMELMTTFNNYKENNQNDNIVVGFLIAPKDAKEVNTDILPNLDYWYYRTGKSFHIYCLGYYSKINRDNENTEPLAYVNGQNWYFSNEVFVNELKKLENNCNELIYSGEIDLILLPLALEKEQYKINYNNVKIYCDLVRLSNKYNLSIRSLFEKIIKGRL